MRSYQRRIRALKAGVRRYSFLARLIQSSQAFLITIAHSPPYFRDYCSAGPEVAASQAVDRRQLHLFLIRVWLRRNRRFVELAPDRSTGGDEFIARNRTKGELFEHLIPGRLLPQSRPGEMVDHAAGAEHSPFRPRLVFNRSLPVRNCDTSFCAREPKWIGRAAPKN